MGQIITVNFRGDDLYGFANDDGTYVALKPIVEAMRLDWSAQLKRVKRDTILSEGMAIMATPFGRGGEQDAVCLKLELVNGWLMTIDDKRIPDAEVREKVLVYKRECYGVLFQHFYKGEKTVPVEIPAESRTHEAEGAKIRMVTEARQTFGTGASSQLWFKLGLPVVPAMMEQNRQLDLIEYSRIKASGDGAAA